MYLEAAYVREEVCINKDLVWWDQCLLLVSHLKDREL